MHGSGQTRAVRYLAYGAVFLAQLWLAHALGYLVHEYAHSFTAWIFRYKSNPLALDYGHLSFSNALLLGDIDENVDYDPIFAAGHGGIASFIAVAGVLIGNGIGYMLSRYGYHWAKQRGRLMLTQFFFFAVPYERRQLSLVRAEPHLRHPR